MFVEKFNGSLKASELHHGVWDLPHPQRGEALVEPENKHKSLVNENHYTAIPYNIRAFEQTMTATRT